MKAKKDFFISYTHNDEQWATWIAATLEAAQKSETEKYTTVIQAWDFKPGMDFAAQMQDALKVCERFIAIVSKEYLSKKGWSQREWTSALAQDKELEKGLFIPIWIEENMKPEDLGLFSTIVAIDLFGKSDEEAKQELINGVSTANRPRNTPSFPGTTKKELNPGDLPFNNLPSRNTHFTGRVEKLEEIRRNFQEGKNVSLQAVRGIGGIGKTAIALEYAYEHALEYNCLWWVNAESAATIESNYSEFAKKQEIVNADASMDIIVAAVKEWMQQHDKWLFIYDNAEDLATLDKYRPNRNLGQRHILITSRNNGWHSIATTVDTKVFLPEDAKAFLYDYTKLPDTAKQEELIEKLGHLPLALEQAAAYIVNVIGTTYASYLELYKKTHSEILKIYPGVENKTAYTTWNISFAKIKNESAKQLLNLCAFFAPENLPYQWFTEATEFLPLPLQTDVKDELQFADIRTELTRYSLIEIEGGKISIHCLLQELIRNSLRSEQQEWILLCLQILNKLRYFDFSTAESRTYFLELVPHIVSVTGLSTEKETVETGNLYAFLGYGFDELADYPQALEWYLKALAIREKVWGKEDPDIANTCNNIASVYYNQGKYDEALEWHLKALSISEKVLGKEHPDTATTYNNIAEVYDNQGKYAEALEWHLKALAINEKVLGKDHPYTASNYNSIALVYKNHGKYDEALGWHFKALAIYEKVLGKEHPSTANIYNNIAAVYRNQGEYSEALKWNLKALAIREKVLGKEHPDTAQTYNNIAAVYNNQGKYAEALEWYLKALAIREKVLGKDHPFTAATYNNIAGVYYSQEDYNKALEWNQKALAINEKVLGKEHPDTATSYNNIAGIYAILGQEDVALKWYLMAFAIYEKRLGEEHPYTKQVQANIYALKQPHTNAGKKVGSEWKTVSLESNANIIDNNTLLNDEELKNQDISILNQDPKMVKATVKDELIYINECKVAFLGYGNVGKSSLIKKLICPNEPIDENCKPTDGICIEKWKPKGFTGTVRFWDFGGQEIMKCMHRCFLTERSVCVIILDGREDATIDKDAVYWLNTVKTYAPDALIIIAINKIDLSPHASLREKELRIAYPNIEHIIKSSAVNADGWIELNKCILETVKRSYGFTKKVYVRLRQLMNAIEKTYEPYITQDVYEELCNENGINSMPGDNITTKEFQENFLEWLKVLGVLHYYKNDPNKEHHDEERYKILKPDWLTNGIYRIINRTPANNGLISFSDLRDIMGKNHENDILQNTLYDTSEVELILHVMRFFKHSYKVSIDDVDKEFIPSKLIKDAPDVEIYKSHQSLHICWETKESLLPLNVLHRLMIDKFKQLDIRRVWRYGAIFNSPNGSTTALIEMDINETAMHVYVKSDCGEAKEYLAEIRGAINLSLEKIRENVIIDEVLYHTTPEGKVGKISFQTVLEHKRAGKDDVYIEGVGFIKTDTLLKLNFSDETIKEELKIIKITNNNYYTNCDMSQQNNSGNNSPIQNNKDVGTASQTNDYSVKNFNLPETITDDQWKQFKEFLNEFLLSDEADELCPEDRKILRNKVKNADKISGWKRFREYFADTANTITIATPLVTFVAAHGDKIAHWLLNLFS